MSNKVDEAEPGRGRALSSSAELVKWLDRHCKATAHRNTSTDLDHELGFASILYQTCLQLFGEIWKRLNQDRSRPRAWHARTRDNLSRLVLWGDFLDHGSLDACLERSTEIRDCVFEVFHDMGKTLIEGASKLISDAVISQDNYIKDLLKDVAMLLEKVDSILGAEEDVDSHTEIEDSETEYALVDPNITFDKNMSLHVTCLMDLSPTLERMVNDSNLAGEDPMVGPNGITFHVTESAKQYVLQVHDKFRDAPKSLVERLGEANWQRFVRIRASLQKQEHEALGDFQELGAAKSAFVPMSKFHDSGLGSSAPTRSHFAASVTSHSSFVSTEAEVSVGRLRVPPTPEEVGNGLPFECFICGQRQSKIKNRVDWKIHVFQDLQPYICTFDCCRNMLVTFHTRKLWSEHEFSEHRLDRFLKCHDCSEEFMDEDKFIEHLRDSHHNRASGSQLLAIISAAKTSVPIAIDSQKCPLCFQDGWKSQRNFAAHVGRHMEEIALACLPKDAEDEDESTDGEDKLQDQSVHDQQEGEDQTERDCVICHTRVTPKWRRGPSGNLDLCNSCGLRWAKRARSVGSKAGSLTSSYTKFVLDASHTEFINYAAPKAYHVPSGVLLSDDEEDFMIKCICTYTDDDDNDGDTVYCEKCETWQHIECYYPDVPVPELHLCSDCGPRELDGKKSIDRQMRLRVESDSGGRNSRRHATMANKTELETLPYLNIMPNPQRHIITSLQQQGPFTSWQATITVEQRAMQVKLLIDSLRLRKPVIELPRAVQVALSFEQKALVQSQSRDAYVAMCKEKLGLIHDTRQQQQNNASVRNAADQEQKGHQFSGGTLMAQELAPKIPTPPQRLNERLDLNIPEKVSPGHPTGATSTTSTRVQKHRATFQCSLCPKSFTRAYNLRSHLRTHNDEYLYFCSVCGKSFERQQDRTRHERLHSSEKKFVCKGELDSGGSWGCGRTFAREAGLESHFKSEAGRVCTKPLFDERKALIARFDEREARSARLEAPLEKEIDERAAYITQLERALAEAKDPGYDGVTGIDVPRWNVEDVLEAGLGGLGTDEGNYVRNAGDAGCKG